VVDLPYVDEARLSDKELGSYEILSQVNPDIVALGHDQYALEESLHNFLRQSNQKELSSIKVVRLEKYVPPNMD